MQWNKGPLMYEGKGKQIFSIEGDDSVILQEFKNQLTAFNAEKKAQMEGKGQMNCLITSAIFNFLKEKGIQTHFIQKISNQSWVTKKLDMIALEVVVRNKLAGSTAKKFQIAEGTLLESPLVEFFYKKDELSDPFISDEQALMLKVVDTKEQLEEMKFIALKINTCLVDFFHACEIELIDFKLEFGLDENGHIILGDEITPDSCRLWDLKTQEKMDKDRFRRDLGGVLEAYKEVWNRIEKKWSEYV